MFTDIFECHKKGQKIFFFAGLHLNKHFSNLTNYNPVIFARQIPFEKRGKNTVIQIVINTSNKSMHVFEVSVYYFWIITLFFAVFAALLSRNQPVNIYKSRIVTNAREIRAYFIFQPLFSRVYISLSESIVCQQ